MARSCQGFFDELFGTAAAPIFTSKAFCGSFTQSIYAVGIRAGNVSQGLGLCLHCKLGNAGRGDLA